MKRLNILSWIFLGMFFSSCSDWLDVSPKTELKSEVLYTTENGFKSALTGIYGRMTKLGMYGQTLSFQFLEELAQRYDNHELSDAQRAQIYDYKNYGSSKSSVNGIWAEMYQNIANINNLLKFLELNGQYIKTPGYRELMKGEALGLRAFHYFDLLRMWGPGRFEEHKSEKVFPWRNQFTPDKVPLMTADSIAIRILEDLKAEELLLKDDPMEYRSNSDEPFMGFRQHRMNKYAVKALMARVYLWIGDKENAALRAREVIDGCGLDLVKDNREDVAFFDETLFGLNMYNMYKQLSSYFSAVYTDGATMWITQKNVEETFDASTVGLNDIRYKSGYGFVFYQKGEGMAICRKYLEVLSSIYKEKIPLIRLSEMYYILAEALPLDQGSEFFNRVRKARGISQQYEVTFSSEEQRLEELQAEYRKDFFAEGQFFYFLKRLERTQFYRCPKTAGMEAKDYIFPIPDNEVEFGWVEY